MTGVVGKMNQLISPEREYLERVYIDYLRREFPSLEKFREYAGGCFQQNQYSVEDRTLSWPRDIRTCLMSHMSFPDIIRLSRTDKRWRAIVVSSTYSPYWKSRYLAEFYSFPPIGIGKVPFVEEAQPQPPPNPPHKKRKTAALAPPAPPPRVTTVLWFEVYQYTWSRQTGRTFPLHRRTLRTFLESKKRVSIPLPFPDIDFSPMRLGGMRLPAHFFPQEIVAMIAGTLLQKHSAVSIAQAICSLIASKPQTVFIDGVMVATNQWGFISDITVQPDLPVIGTPVYNIFRPECPLRAFYANVAAETKGEKCNVPLPQRLTTDWLVYQPLTALLTPDRQDVLRYYWSNV